MNSGGQRQRVQRREEYFSEKLGGEVSTSGAFSFREWNLLQFEERSHDEAKSRFRHMFRL